MNQVAPLLGRSDQTVCDFSHRARVALLNGGRIAELIEQTRLVLDAHWPEPPPSAGTQEVEGSGYDSHDAEVDTGRTGVALPMPRSARVIHLYYWRTLARLTQPQLAARAGIARETIARIENGRPALWTVVLR